MKQNRLHLSLDLGVKHYNMKGGLQDKGKPKIEGEELLGRHSIKYLSHLPNSAV